MTGKETSDRQNQSENGSRDQAGKPDIDLQALAEKILKLLKDEARIERERQGMRRS